MSNEYKSYIISSNKIEQFVSGEIFWCEAIDRTDKEYFGKQFMVKKLGILYREYNNKKPLIERAYFSIEQIKIFRSVRKEEING